MIWKISLTSQAHRFLDRKKISEQEIFEFIKKAIKKFQGEDINIDIKKLKGEWSGFYKIKTGKLRIILAFDFDNSEVFIEKIDWRGGAYKSRK